VKTKLKLARVGMNMEAATIVKWHKRPGDSVKAGEALYDFETEKVTQEVPSPADGTLTEIYVQEGETAQVGDQLCLVDLILPGKT
jgi:2-oxoglutarate dehydrogenase E2 component (dihydrolipoamide succinyltransferase)